MSGRAPRRKGDRCERELVLTRARGLENSPPQKNEPSPLRAGCTP
jgi:hypothetical protein